MPRIFIHRKVENRVSHLSPYDVVEIDSWLDANCPKSKLNDHCDEIYFHRRPDLNLFKILFADRYRIVERICIKWH